LDTASILRTGFLCAPITGNKTLVGGRPKVKAISISSGEKIMRQKTWVAIGAGSCVVALLGLSNITTDKAPRADETTPSRAKELTNVEDNTVAGKPVNPKLVAAYNQFGFNIFRQLRGKDEGNLLVSPLSIATALGMTYNGARGTTRDEMARTLGLDALQLQEVNEANQALRSSLNAPGTGVELLVANSLWARQGIAFGDV